MTPEYNEDNFPTTLDGVADDIKKTLDGEGRVLRVAWSVLEHWRDVILQEDKRLSDALKVTTDSAVELLRQRAVEAERNARNKHETAQEFLARAERAEAELAECRKDSERYKFLRTRGVCFRNADATFPGWTIGEQTEWAYGEHADSAIDAAKEGK